MGALQIRQQWAFNCCAEAFPHGIAFWVLGAGGFYGFIMHLVFGSFLAKQISWSNSPFQNPLACALTIGTVDFSSVLYRKRENNLKSMDACTSC
ncbi:DUF6790 family protein [Synechococcus sp. UW179A]|uniref:DUF6790 family protein n=1 Tax=Synechococcus sp. UW179A TaxID=2575510 RepID=UPI000E0EF609